MSSPKQRKLSNTRSAQEATRASKRKARTERMRYIFNKCALELDPTCLRPAQTLAEEFGWHRSTLWKWVRAGAMPEPKARVLVNRFGIALDFALEDLT